MGRARDANFALTKELDTTKREVERLKKQLEARELNIGEYATGVRVLQSNEDMLTSEFDLLKRENEILEQRNLALRAQLNDEIVDKKSEGYLLLENESQKADIIRLIKMLQSTKEVS